MEVFGTTIAAGTIVYNFLVACSSFSGDAKSLAARFHWDLVALKAIRDYFEQRKAQNADANLSEEHKQLLRITSEYLDGFADEVQKSLGKIERKGLLKDTANRLLWATRENDVKKVQQELEYWTDKFGVRVLALPEEVRNVINTSANSNAPALVKSNKELLDFTRLASDSDTKQRLASEMLSKDATAISKKIEHGAEISFLPLEVDKKQFIFATRRVPLSATPGNTEFEKLKSAMGVLAATLNHLSPSADVRLLSVEYCFYHADSNQFLLAQRTPYKTTSMMTLGQMIERNTFPHTNAPLGERFKLAYKLAEAVVFLHAAGFLHKNITASSAVALRKAPSIRESGPGVRPLLMDEVYLMGFDLVRSIESRTSKEGAVNPTAEVEVPLPIWDRDIYTHPERQRGASSVKYQKGHDVYSLGVVLLEVGLWEPLSSAADAAARDIISEEPTTPKRNSRKKKSSTRKGDATVGESAVRDVATRSTMGGLFNEWDDRNTWPAKLRDIAIGPMGLTARVGRRYQAVVEWCLSLVGDDGIETTEFVQNVLDPLEEIARALL